MAKHNTIAAIDAGNGGVNAVVRKSARTTNQVYFPSARAVATGDTLGYDREKSYKVVEWQGQRYAFGEDAIDIRSGVESHIGVSRYGNEFHAFLTAVALAECKVANGGVDLMLLAPPGYYKEAKERIQRCFGEYENWREIAYLTDKRPRKWSYDHIGVLPEGLAAALALALDNNGNMIDSDVMGGDLLIADGGMYTMDTVLLRDGNFDPETLQHATNSQAGIKKQVLLPVLHQLRNEYTDCRNMEVEHVDRVLRNGMEFGNWVLEIGSLRGNRAINTEALFKFYIAQFANYVANRIIDDAYDGLSGIKGVFLIGGWAEMVEPYLVDFYGSKVLTVNTVPHLNGMHPIDMNAHGALRYRLLQQKSEG